MPTQTKYNDTTYKARARVLKAKHLPCWICGRPIDYNAKPRTPQAFTADHVNPIANGGHLHGELKPAHHGCNSRRGNKTQPKKTNPPQKNSRPW